MEDNKLYYVLTQLDKITHNRLRKYIYSPYFNANKALMQLYDVLTTHIFEVKKGTISDLDKQAIWLAIHPEKPFSDVRLRKALSDLLKLVEDFLAQQVYDKQYLQQTAYLTEAVRERRLYKLYGSALRYIDCSKDKSVEKAADYYWHQFDFEKQRYFLQNAEINRFEKSNIEAIINYLDQFYLSEKLRWYCAMLSRQNLVSHDYKVLFIEEIIKHLETYQIEAAPIVRIYYLTYLTQTDHNNTTHYTDLKALLESYWPHLPLHEAEQCYTNLLSYCIKKLNQGQQDFLKEFWLLSKFLLKTDILLATGHLNPGYFRNAVMAALRLGEYAWTEKFITDYSPKLPDNVRDKAMSYNLALVYFYQKKYDKVISLLQSVDYNDLAYNLSAKAMLLAVYYELDNDAALLSLMDSFKTYLYRHKEITRDRRLAYLNLMKYIGKLLKITPGDTAEIERVRLEMAEDRRAGIASESWILEKLNELS